MPDGANLVKEMNEALPLFCFSNKRNTKTLAAQGLKLSEKTRLEVERVHNLFEEGGVACGIRFPDSEQVLIMSITGLVFKDNGPIDEKISEYIKARIEWLKQEELRDMEQGTSERIKTVGLSGGYSSRNVSRNSPCPCGSGKKYKRCCGN